ncbi:MAG TPA: Ig-like domain-containing protein, partial [Caulobacteraceae bacterium]|nr:Ig-like domain-containing protein [Caulobacteraceae bacterium]
MRGAAAGDQGGGPAHGTLTLNANGSFVYTPTLGFAGKDSFSYIASDGLASGPATMATITVTASPPTSAADSYSDAAGHVLTTTVANGVLANDTDPNGLALTAALAPGGGPAHGTLTLNPDGSFRYTPTAGYVGADSFSYVASDGLASGPATKVTLTIGAGAPVSSPDAYAAAAGHALTTTAANGVLANDTDPNGLTLTAAGDQGGGPAHGTLTLNANGSFVYTPTLGFAGADHFSYIASDGLASGPATMATITVTASPPTS